MTEEEWLTATDPTPMLEFLRGKASERKLRLFGVACCYEVRDLIAAMEEGSIGCGFVAVRLGEELADARATPEDVRAAIEDRVGMIDSGSSPYGWLLSRTLPGLADVDAQRGAIQTAASAGIARGRQVTNLVDFARGERSQSTESSRAEGRIATEAAYSRQCILLRDIFPFHPITLDPSWLTSSVVSLAQHMYDTQEFTAMPILADALMDAGCDNPQILEHCRGPGPHVKGCWVCDLCLNKS